MKKKIIEEGMESLDHEKPKKKVKYKIFNIIFTIIILVFLLSGVFTMVKYYFNLNFKTIMNKSVSHFKSYTDILESNYKLKTSDTQIIGTIKADLPEDIFGTVFKDIKLNYDLNSVKGNQDLDFMLEKNKETRYHINLKTINYDSYLNLNNLYNKNIYLGKEENEEEYEYTEFSYIIEKIYNSFLKNIKKNQINELTTTIELNDKKEKVKKINVTFTKKEIVKIYNKILSDLREDNKTKETATSLEKMTEKDLEIEKIEYSIYLDSLLNKFVGIDININEKKEKYSLTYRNNDKPELKVRNKDEELLTAKLHKNGNIKTINYNLLKDTYGSIIISGSNSKKSIEFSYYQKEVKIELSGNSKIKEVTKKKEYEIKSEYTLLYRNYDELMEMNFTNDYTVKESNKKINKPKSSINYEDITEEEYTEIQNKAILVLQEILGITDENEYDEELSEL